jgi:hypothetical protein
MHQGSTYNYNIRLKLKYVQAFSYSADTLFRRYFTIFYIYEISSEKEDLSALSLWEDPYNLT